MYMLLSQQPFPQWNHLSSCDKTQCSLSCSMCHRSGTVSISVWPAIMSQWLQFVYRWILQSLLFVRSAFSVLVPLPTRSCAEGLQERRTPCGHTQLQPKEHNPTAIRSLFSGHEHTLHRSKYVDNPSIQPTSHDLERM